MVVIFLLSNYLNSSSFLGGECLGGMRGRKGWRKSVPKTKCQCNCEANAKCPHAVADPISMALEHAPFKPLLKQRLRGFAEARGLDDVVTSRGHEPRRALLGRDGDSAGKRVWLGWEGQTRLESEQPGCRIAADSVSAEDVTGSVVW